MSVRRPSGLNEFTASTCDGIVTQGLLKTTYLISEKHREIQGALVPNANYVGDCQGL